MTTITALLEKHEIKPDLSTEEPDTLSPFETPSTFESFTRLVHEMLIAAQKAYPVHGHDEWKNFIDKTEADGHYTGELTQPEFTTDQAIDALESFWAVHNSGPRLIYNFAGTYMHEAEEGFVYSNCLPVTADDLSDFIHTEGLGAFLKGACRAARTILLDAIVIKCTHCMDDGGGPGNAWVGNECEHEDCPGIYDVVETARD